ncbi:hypothetical protein BS47DRAFT_1358974 [Hydnum rufescens UP504]|uniref:Uncharacterized protein n=1 Tax=Hydnum rufescens UP504 TaxID=1448309 RepID=A0A9P6B5S5_9AGAM|nr:hypothetical protein BS47DRAFT_1358974 [Hydnum rufescens UP504]
MTMSSVFVADPLKLEICINANYELDSTSFIAVRMTYYPGLSQIIAYSRHITCVCMISSKTKVASRLKVFTGRVWSAGMKFEQTSGGRLADTRVRTVAGALTEAFAGVEFGKQLRIALNVDISPLMYRRSLIQLRDAPSLIIPAQIRGGHNSAVETDCQMWGKEVASDGKETAPRHRLDGQPDGMDRPSPSTTIFQIVHGTQKNQTGVELLACFQAAYCTSTWFPQLKYSERVRGGSGGNSRVAKKSKKELGSQQEDGTDNGDWAEPKLQVEQLPRAREGPG